MADGNEIRGAKGGSESQHVPVEAPDSLRSIAFFRILDLVSEGEIGGLVNGLQSVFCDETPLVNVDGSSNFPKAHVEARNGTPDQTYIKGFDATENEISVGVELKSSAAWVQSLTDTTLSAVRITVGVPALSQANTSNGDINGYAIAYKIEVSTDGGAYSLAYNGNITGKTTTHFQRSTRVDLPAATTGWQIRVTRLTANANSSAIADTTTIDSYTMIVDGKRAYPNSALVGVMGDASQFSNIPNRAYDLWGRIISVPSNYDAKTRAYTGTWDGSFKPSWTDNPAWVFYDLIVNTRYGLGNLIDAALVDKWARYKIAQYCDGLVDDGNGGQEPRFTCNLYLQSQADAYKLLNDISSIFRGIAYWAGGAIVANADMPEDPVYTYTDANVIDGKFTYTSSPRKQRYTAAQVTWNDPRNFYRAKVEYVEYQPGIDRYGWQQTEVTGVGCTSQGMAQRIGKWLCMTACEETDTVTFGVGMDGTIAAPGQIIRIADAARAGKRQGGRVHSATTTAITVDSAPTVVQGDSLTVNMPDGTAQTRTVSAVSGKTITVGTAFTTAPQPEAVWTVESTTLVAQTFRVVSVKEDTADDKISFTITALQHNASKFAAIDTGTAIVVPPTSVLRPKTLPAPASVTLTCAETAGDVMASTVLNIAWAAVNGAVAYMVEWRKDNGNWQPLGRHYACNAEISYAIAGDYVARVRAVGASGDMSVPITSNTFTVVDQTTKPGFFTDLSNDIAAAQADADAANAELAKVASDNVLSAGEKPVVIRDNSVILTERAGIDAQATAYGVTTEKTAYDNACSALAAYLAGLTTPTAWNNLSGDTTIDGPTFRGKFADVYTTRQTLLNAIYAAAKGLADNAQGTADVAGNVVNPRFRNGMYGWRIQGGGSWVASSDACVYTGAAGVHNHYLANDDKAFFVAKQGDCIKYGSVIDASAGADGVFKVGVWFYDAAGSYIISNYADAATVGAKKSYTKAVHAPANAAYVAVVYAAYNVTAGTYAASSPFLQHVVENLDAVDDGPTYGRVNLTNLTAGDLDLAKPVRGRTLVNISDAGGRYAAAEAGADKTAGKSIDVLADGSNFRRVGAGYTDTSGRVTRLWDGTAVRQAGDVWDGANRARSGLASDGRIVPGIHPFERMTNRTADNVTPTDSRRWAGQSDDNLVKTRDFLDGSIGTWDSGTIILSGSDNVLNVYGDGSGAYVYDNTATAGGYFPASPNEVFDLHADVLRTCQLRVNFYDRNGGYISPGSVVLNSGNGYATDIDVATTAPAGTAQARIAMRYPIELYPTQTLAYGRGLVVRRRSAMGLRAGKGLGGDGKVTDGLNDVDRLIDGTTYGRIRGVELDSGYHRIGKPGSGYTIGDQRNLLPVTWAGVGSVLSHSPISYSVSGTTVNVSVAAVTFKGGVSVSFNASSGSVSQAAGTTVDYWCYYRDATYSGGSKTLYITTSPQALGAYPDIWRLGNFTATVSSGGGGSGGSGGGGGGFCVADDMWIRPGRRAGDAEIGDEFDCIDLPTQAGQHVRALRGVTRGVEECVRIITDNGCALECSLSTPFDLPDGRQSTAPRMLGETVITDLGTATVISTALIGPRPVTRAYLGGVSYAAGGDPTRRIYSHNPGTAKP